MGLTFSVARRVATICVLSLAAACSREPAPAAPSAPAPKPAAIGAWGVDLTGMDKGVSPGDDFYRYVSGAWIDKAEIPADLPEWHGFLELGQKADDAVRAIAERLSTSAQSPGSAEQLVADAYATYLDTERINSLGLEPFAADLALFRGLKTLDDVATAIGTPGLPGNSPIGFGPSIDAKDPSRYVLLVTQAGLGLPVRDFYVDANPAFAKVREAYAAYVERMLTLAAYPNPAAEARAIVALEGRFAQVHWPLAKARNKDLTYNPMTRAELKAFAPGFPWDAALAAGGVPAHDRFVIRERDAVAALAKLFAQTPVSTWRAYLTFHYVNAQADIMPKAFDDANFEFYGRVLSGQPEPAPRWRRAVASVNGNYGAGPLGDAVGRLYVKDHFPPESKAAVKALVDNLLAAYQRRIQQLEWMSPETRVAAIRKAQTVRVKIGYPDRWKDYTGLTITRGDAYGNRKRLSLFENARQLGRLNQPTDKDEWSQGPQTVNAYYKAEFNEIAFPAAILQPPFFDPNADPAVNYGAIGGVIGHEMGHGYDDQGAKSDENGVLRSWWKAEDEQRFAALTTQLATQYSAFSPIEGMHVNGSMTSGENIGDLGGLSVSLDAYRHSLGGKEPPVLDGFTGVQRFFLGWGQLWRGKFRDERMRQLVTSDFHSPMMFRVNGVVRNLDDWYDAFGVKAEQKLYLPPAERVHIW
jgi:putative endopeptidase